MRKFTLLIAMLVCAVGFSQEASVKTLGENNPMSVQQMASNSTKVSSAVTAMRKLVPATISSISEGENNPTYANQLSQEQIATLNAIPASLEATQENNPVLANQLSQEQIAALNAVPASPQATSQDGSVYFITNHRDIDVTPAMAAVSSELQASAKGANNPVVLRKEEPAMYIGKQPACSTDGPSNAFENGKSFTQNLGRIVAHDVTVAADENLNLELINLNAFMGATGSGVNAAFVDVYVYEDNAGAPGTIITSELGVVPTAQTVVGANFGFDLWDVEIDLTDVMLMGQAGMTTTYWVGVALETTDASNTFWENSTAGLVGLGEAYDDGLGGGFVLDNTLEGVYTISGDCQPMGGGTSDPCSTDGLSNAFENGKSFTQNLGRIVAHDVTVDADGDFLLEQINLNAFMGATGSGVNAAFVDVYVYEDNAGAPGTLVTSELGLVPASQTVVGGNFGFDVWDVEIDVTDVMLMGQAGMTTTYWVGVALETTDASNTFWENSTAGLVGLGEAYDDGLGGGFVLDNTLEGVYSIAGTCSTGGGGGSSMPCATEALSNAFENGKSFTQNLGRIVAHDVTVDADGDFLLEQINLNAFMGATGSGVNAAFVDVYVYEDNAGAPGTLVTSELGLVPAAQTVVGANFGFDVWDVEIDLADVMLMGQAGMTTTYWVGVALETTDASNTFWENSTAGLVGLGEAYDDGLGGGFVLDNTLEGVYTIAGTCSTSGGGGSMPCATEALSNAFENGKSFTQNLGRIVAHDVEVVADEDFTLEMINLNAFIGATGSGVNAAFVDVYVYEDNAGAPGTLVTSELGLVPTAQTVVGANFGFDVWDVEIDVADVLLAGQAGMPTTYWVGVALEATDASNAFWENSTAGLVGLGEAYDDGLGGGFVIDNTLEGVYTIAGTCSGGGGGGGGGAACSTEALSNAFENGKSFTQNLGRIVAHDTEVPSATDFTLETVNLNAFIGASGSGVNAAFVDVYIYEDNAGTPGTLITSELGLTPTSQTVVGSNFGFDVWDVEIDVTDILLPSDGATPTTYWIGVALEATDASNSFWENSTAGLVGNGEAYDDGLGGGFVIDNTLEGVYTFSGTCEDQVIVTYDDCEGARPIACGTSEIGDTLTATNDAVDECGTAITAPGVWYVFEDTSGLASVVTVTTCSALTDYDTKLNVYSGDCSALTCVDGNDDAGADCAVSGLQSQVVFNSDGNTTFYILVQGFGGNTGNFELTMTCDLVPPPNDEIANSIDVDEIGFPYTDPNVATIAATLEAGTPVDCDNAGVRGVWYNFVPELDGTATAEVISPAGFTSVTFYTAPSESATETELTLVDYFDNQCVPQNDASIPVVTGQAYYVYVANMGGSTDIVIDGDFFLGANDNKIEGFAYYPNPTTGVVNLSSIDLIENVEVYNILGQKVVDQNVNAVNTNIDITGLSVGAYIMKVSINGQVGTYKIIKR